MVQVTLLINYNFPRSSSSYGYRCGPKRRFGAKGCVISFVTNKDVPWVKMVESELHIRIGDLPADISFL